MTGLVMEMDMGPMGAHTIRVKSFFTRARVRSNLALDTGREYVQARIDFRCRDR